RATRLAHRLRGLGVGPDVVVPLLGERSVPLLVAMLAVWQAGGAYLPLDPRTPVGRLGGMLGGGRAPVGLVGEALRPLLDAALAGPAPDPGSPAGSGRPVPDRSLPVLLDLDAGAGPPSPVATEGPDAEWDWETSRPGPDHLAYVIYT